MKSIFKLVACLFLCVSFKSAAAINYSGNISVVDDPSGILSSDLAFNNLQVGDSYTASFNFGSAIAYASGQDSIRPEYQIHSINDPNYSASISFFGQPTIDSVSALGDIQSSVSSHVYVGLAQDTLIKPGVYGDTYILQAEVTDNVWMVFQLGDSTGTALSDTDFYIETSLDKWDITSVYLQHIEFNPGYTELGMLVGSNAIPVPAAAWLFGSALVGLGLLRRK